MKNLDIFGYRPNFKATKEQNLHKTSLGCVMTMLYILMSAGIIYASTAYSHLDLGSAPLLKKRML